MNILSAGSIAPNFTLRSTPDQWVSLAEFRGQNVILAFYPADWSPVCGDQLSLYNELLAEFARYGAQLLAISVDGPWSHAALSRDRRDNGLRRRTIPPRPAPLRAMRPRAHAQRDPARDQQRPRSARGAGSAHGIHALYLERTAARERDDPPERQDAGARPP